MRILSRICTGIGALLIFFSYGALDAVDNLVTAVIAMLCMFSGGCLIVLIGSELDYIKPKKEKCLPLPQIETSTRRMTISNYRAHCSTESEF